MGTDILTSFGNLQHELEEAKNSLKGVDESIKRLIGRDPSELPPRNIIKRSTEDKTRTVTKSQGRTRFFTENEEPPVKRRSNISVFKRLSDKVPDDDPPVPHRGLISKVIVTPKEVPSRQQALEAQNKDEKFKARNKRMFGALLGTLQKFQQEETKLKQREQKRAELEKKIDDHEIKEKEEVRKERQELFLNRKKKQAEIKVIELKMLRMKEYSSWEQSQKPRVNFIHTKAKPHIHYLPRKMSDQARKYLEESSKEIQEMIDKKKKQVAEELEHIEFKMKKSFDHKFGSQGEEKEENHTEQHRSHGHKEHDHTEDDHIDENQVDYSLADTKEESNNQVEHELETTELNSIQLPEDKENKGVLENNVGGEIGSGIDNTVPDPPSSMFQAEYYHQETGNNDTSIQLDNFGPQTGESLVIGDVVK